MAFSTLNGQDAGAELEKLMAAFPADKTAFFQASYYYYASPGAERPSDSLRAEFIRRGEKLYARLGEIELIYDGKHSFLADHEYRRIYLQDVPQENIPAFDIRQFVETGRRLGLEAAAYQPGKGLKGVRFHAPGISKTEIRLAYEPGNYYLREFSISISLPEGAPPNEYNNTRIEGRYYGYRQSAEPFPYTVERLFRRAGQKLAPVGKYSGYEVAGSL